MDTQIGLIGYFDILGYQNLLEKNEPEDIAQSVLPFLTDINNKVCSEMTDFFEKRGDQESPFLSIVKSIKWLIFSDTILMTLPFDSSEGDISVIAHWVSFMSACTSLQEEMFKVGLPVRGVIDYGKFYVKDNCFAGRTIVEAYQLCNQLDLAACVFNENAQKELNNIDAIYIKHVKTSIFNLWVSKYLIPKKDGESQCYVLTSHVCNPDDDIRKQVLSAFWGHNKDIPRSVQNKISNTEQWLTFLKMNKK